MFYFLVCFFEHSTRKKDCKRTEHDWEIEVQGVGLWYWKGGCCGQLATVQRWLLYRGGHCTEVAAVESWPLYRGGHCREVATVER